MKKPALPTDGDGGDQASLQKQRDGYHQLLLETIQDFSLQQRRLNRLAHQIKRLERNIDNIDSLAAQHSITLKRELTT